MKKFLIGLVAGLILAALGCMILFFLALRLGERRPVIPSEAVLVLRLNDDLPERAPVEIPLPFFEDRNPLTVHDTWDILRKAAADRRIKAILLEPQGVEAGWAKLAEVRADLLQFKKSGKPLIAYLRNPGTREYYLATAADKIYFTSEDVLDVKGLRVEATYYRRTLDKLGVQVEVEYAGKYKDAADEFARTSMTPETREVLNSVLDRIYGHIVDTIASSRHKSPEEIRAAIDDGPFLANQAKDKGLVDGLIFEDQAWDELKGRLGSRIQKLSAREYARVPASSLGLEGSTRIAMIVGSGAITRGGSSSPFNEEEGIQSAPFISMLRQVGDDASVRAVILRIDSPGGDAIASDEILHEVKTLSKKKPLVISMSDLAASGGYYMAMSGDPVLAYENTYTGSIGVLFGKVNLSALYDKLGFDTEILMRGRNAAVDTTVRPLSEEGRRKLREGIDSVYRSFLSRVAEGRHRSVAEIEPLAQGRVWLGSQALANKLVDELGGLDTAISKVRERAHIPATEKVRIVVYPEKKTVFQQLFGQSEVDLFSAFERRKLHAAENAVKQLLGIDPAYFQVLRQGGMLRLAPYTLRVE